MVMASEADGQAREVQDDARRASGLRIARADDPFGTLGLLHELRRGSVVGLQIDRVRPGLRARAVALLDAPGSIPEGPLRLAAASGAPILPIFTSRRGYRSYLIDIRPPLFLPRRPSEAELDACAQTIPRTSSGASFALTRPNGSTSARGSAEMSFDSRSP